MFENIQTILALAILATFLTACIAFFREQQRLLQDIRPQNRLLTPAKIWLQLIPVYGVFFQFRVVARIADSIRAELSDTSDEDILSDTLPVGVRPTFNKGLTLAIVSCFTFIQIPLVQGLVSIAGLTCWIIYWIDLRKYHQQIKARNASAT